MFSLRIVSADHYLASPLPGLDVCYSDFRCVHVRQVPIVRIFGSTPAGQKTCLHLHGVFPYIYVNYNNGVGYDNVEREMQQIAVSLDHALNISLGNASTLDAQHVYKVSLVSGISMYGYHSNPQHFLKIYFYNPLIVKRAVELLQNGAVMNKAFQPYEAHIPFILQFFIDYNLYGMNLLNLASVKFRRKKENVNRSTSFSDQSTVVNNSSLNSSSTLNQSASSDILFRKWNPDLIPSGLCVSEQVERQSVCELEVDALDVDILNRMELNCNSGMSPGLKAIWDEERFRRQMKGSSVKLTPEESQNRNVMGKFEAELRYQQKLKEKLLGNENISQPIDLSQHLNAVINNFPHGNEMGVEKTENACPVDAVVDEQIVASVSESLSQSRAGSSLLNSQDEELVDILERLCSTRNTLAEDEDSILSQTLTQQWKNSDRFSNGEVEENDDDLETREMSQLVWQIDPELEEENRQIPRDLDEEVLPQVDGPVDPKSNNSGLNRSSRSNAVSTGFGPRPHHPRPPRREIATPSSSSSSPYNVGASSLHPIPCPLTNQGFRPPPSWPSQPSMQPMPNFFYPNQPNSNPFQWNYRDCNSWHHSPVDMSQGFPQNPDAKKMYSSIPPPPSWPNSPMPRSVIRPNCREFSAVNPFADGYTVVPYNQDCVPPINNYPSGPGGYYEPGQFMPAFNQNYEMNLMKENMKYNEYKQQHQQHQQQQQQQQQQHQQQQHHHHHHHQQQHPQPPVIQSQHHIQHQQMQQHPQHHQHHREEENQLVVPPPGGYNCVDTGSGQVKNFISLQRISYMSQVAWQGDNARDVLCHEFVNETKGEYRGEMVEETSRTAVTMCTDVLAAAMSSSGIDMHSLTDVCTPEPEKMGDATDGNDNSTSVMSNVVVAETEPCVSATCMSSSSCEIDAENSGWVEESNSWLLDMDRQEEVNGNGETMEFDDQIKEEQIALTSNKEQSENEKEGDVSEGKLSPRGEMNSEIETKDSTIENGDEPTKENIFQGLSSKLPEDLPEDSPLSHMSLDSPDVDTQESGSKSEKQYYEYPDLSSIIESEELLNKQGNISSIELVHDNELELQLEESSNDESAPDDESRQVTGGVGNEDSSQMIKDNEMKEYGSETDSGFSAISDECQLEGKDSCDSSGSKEEVDGDRKKAEEVIEMLEDLVEEILDNVGKINEERDVEVSGKEEVVGEDVGENVGRKMVKDDEGEVDEVIGGNEKELVDGVVKGSVEELIAQVEKRNLRDKKIVEDVYENDEIVNKFSPEDGDQVENSPEELIDRIQNSNETMRENFDEINENNENCIKISNVVTQSDSNENYQYSMMERKEEDNLVDYQEFLHESISPTTNLIEPIKIIKKVITNLDTMTNDETLSINSEDTNSEMQLPKTQRTVYEIKQVDNQKGNENLQIYQEANQLEAICSRKESPTYDQFLNDNRFYDLDKGEVEKNQIRAQEDYQCHASVSIEKKVTNGDQGKKEVEEKSRTPVLEKMASLVRRALNTLHGRELMTDLLIPPSNDPCVYPSACVANDFLSSACERPETTKDKMQANAESSCDLLHASNYNHSIYYSNGSLAGRRRSTPTRRRRRRGRKRMAKKEEVVEEDVGVGGAALCSAQALSSQASSSEVKTRNIGTNVHPHDFLRRRVGGYNVVRYHGLRVVVADSVRLSDLKKLGKERLCIPKLDEEVVGRRSAKEKRSFKVKAQKELKMKIKVEVEKKKRGQEKKVESGDGRKSESSVEVVKKKRGQEKKVEIGDGRKSEGNVEVVKKKRGQEKKVESGDGKKNVEMSVEVEKKKRGQEKKVESDDGKKNVEMSVEVEKKKRGQEKKVDSGDGRKSESNVEVEKKKRGQEKKVDSGDDKKNVETSVAVSRSKRLKVDYKPHAFSHIFKFDVVPEAEQKKLRESKSNKLNSSQEKGKECVDKTVEKAQVPQVKMVSPLKMSINCNKKTSCLKSPPKATNCKKSCDWNLTESFATSPVPATKRKRTRKKRGDDNIRKKPQLTILFGSPRKNNNNNANGVPEVPKVVVEDYNTNTNKDHSNIYKDAMWNMSFISPSVITNNSTTPPRCWSPNESGSKGVNESTVAVEKVSNELTANDGWVPFSYSLDALVTEEDDASSKFDKLKNGPSYVVLDSQPGSEYGESKTGRGTCLLLHNKLDTSDDLDECSDTSSEHVYGGREKSGDNLEVSSILNNEDACPVCDQEDNLHEISERESKWNRDESEDENDLQDSLILSDFTDEEETSFSSNLTSQSDPLIGSVFTQSKSSKCVDLNHSQELFPFREEEMEMKSQSETNNSEDLFQLNEDCAMNITPGQRQRGSTSDESGVEKLSGNSVKSNDQNEKIRGGNLKGRSSEEVGRNSQNVIDESLFSSFEYEKISDTSSFGDEGSNSKTDDISVTIKENTEIVKSNPDFSTTRKLPNTEVSSKEHSKLEESGLSSGTIESFYGTQTPETTLVNSFYKTQEFWSKKRILVFNQRPPGREEVASSLQEHGIPLCRHVAAHYSKTEDIPDKQVGYNMKNFESKYESKGIENWRTIMAAQFGSEGCQEILEQLKNNPRMKTALLSDRRCVIITPNKNPPSKKEVEEWIAERKAIKKKQEEEMKSKMKCVESPVVNWVKNCDPTSSHELFHSTPQSRHNSPLMSPNFTPILPKKRHLYDNEQKQNQTPLRKRICLMENVTEEERNLERSEKSSSVESVIENIKRRKSMKWSKHAAKLAGKDVSTSQIDGPTPSNIYGFKVSYDNLQQVRAIHEHQYLVVCSLELHVRTRQNLKPDPEFDCIIGAFYCIYNDYPDEKCQQVVGCILLDGNTSEKDDNHCVCDDEAKQSCTYCQKLNRHLAARSGVTNLKITFVHTEHELLEEIVRLIGCWDPDIFVGYEIEMLSWGYLLQRAQVLGQNMISSLSRIPHIKPTNSAIKLNEDVDLEGSQVLKGRIMLSLWQLMRHEVSLNIYRFENVAYHILHQRIPLYSFRSLTEWFDHESDLFRWRVIEHYITRARGNIQLLLQVDLINRTSELARLFGIQFYEVLSRGSQFRVESMMLRMAKASNYIAVSPSIQQRNKARAPECLALILEPESKFYSNPVLVLDFQSLYPSMVIAYNYCFTTCLGHVDSLGGNDTFKFGCTSLNVPADNLRQLIDQLHISPTGIAFVKSEVRRGVLPKMLEDILETRIMVKKALKEYKDDKSLKRVLDARQLGLKLIANVTYGYTAANYSGRMPCSEVADSIVGKARETLEKAIEMVNSNSVWNARVVYGDTDSMFVHLPGRSKDDAFRIGQEIADAVTASNPKPVKLKFEKVYLPCILQTKKRYVGYMYETPEQKDATFDAKGIETVRRDGCPAVVKVLEKSIRLLFTSRDLSRVKSYVQRQFQKMFTGRISLQDLTLAREYRGKSGYKPNACVPALELTKRMLREDRRAEPRVGERVPYVIVYGTPGAPLFQLVRQPEEVLVDVNLRINAHYYVNNLLIPPLQRVFGLLQADVSQWFKSISRLSTQRLTGVGYLANRKKGTISQYFDSASCPVCSQPSSRDLCPQCRRDPQKVVVTLNEQIRAIERTHQKLSQVCCACRNDWNCNKNSCVSLDCPVFYSLAQATRDLNQVPYLRKHIDLLLEY